MTLRRIDSRIVGAALLASAGMICSTVRPVRAQAEAPADTTKKISLSFTQAPIQSVLKVLFGSQGINYALGPGVQGNVTVDINNVSFDTALHAVLRSANPQLTYDFTGNVFQLKVKRDDLPAVGPPAIDPGSNTLSGDQTYVFSKIPIDRYDASEVAGLVSAILASGGPTVITVGPNDAGGGSGNGGNRGSGPGTSGISR